MNVIIIITRSQTSIVIRVSDTSECKSTFESFSFVLKPRVEGLSSSAISDLAAKC